MAELYHKLVFFSEYQESEFAKKLQASTAALCGRTIWCGIHRHNKALNRKYIYVFLLEQPSTSALDQMQWLTTGCIRRGTFRAGWSQIIYLGRNIEYMCFWVQTSAKVMINANIFIGMKGSKCRGLKGGGFWPSSDNRERRKKKEWNLEQISACHELCSKGKIEQHERGLDFRI